MLLRHLTMAQSRPAFEGLCNFLTEFSNEPQSSNRSYIRYLTKPKLRILLYYLFQRSCMISFDWLWNLAEDEEMCLRGIENVVWCAKMMKNKANLFLKREIFFYLLRPRADLKWDN